MAGTVDDAGSAILAERGLSLDPPRPVGGGRGLGAPEGCSEDSAGAQGACGDDADLLVATPRSSDGTAPPRGDYLRRNRELTAEMGGTYTEVDAEAASPGIGRGGPVYRRRSTRRRWLVTAAGWASCCGARWRRSCAVCCRIFRSRRYRIESESSVGAPSSRAVSGASMSGLVAPPGVRRPTRPVTTPLVRRMAAPPPLAAPAGDDVHVDANCASLPDNTPHDRTTAHSSCQRLRWLEPMTIWVM